jgi:hypothetical protein
MTGKALPFVLGSIAGALGAYALSLSSGSSGDVVSAGDSPPALSTPETLLAPADLSEARTTSADDATVDRIEEGVARARSLH